MIAQLERLAAAGIQLVPSDALPRHFLLERDGFAALVEQSGGGFGSIGAPGLITARGMAMLIWRGERAFFVNKGFEQEATLEQVAELRRFTSDLTTALAHE